MHYDFFFHFFISFGNECFAYDRKQSRREKVWKLIKFYLSNSYRTITQRLVGFLYQKTLQTLESTRQADN